MTWKDGCVAGRKRGMAVCICWGKRVADAMMFDIKGVIFAGIVKLWRKRNWGFLFGIRRV